jgi:hypothetical protein
MFPANPSLQFAANPSLSSRLTLLSVRSRVGIEKPAQKNPPKKTKKTRLKKPKKTHPQVGFFERSSALSINLQFFPLKGL